MVVVRAAQQPRGGVGRRWQGSGFSHASHFSSSRQLESGQPHDYDEDDDDDGDDGDDDDGGGDDDDGDDDGDGDDAESPIGVHNQFSQKLNKEKGGLTARFSD